MNNYYAWKNLDWVIIVLMAVASFAVLPVLLILEAMFDEVNQRLSPASRFRSKAIWHWLGIVRIHGKLCPDSRARKSFGYSLLLPIVLLAALVLRALYLNGAFRRFR